ncbi:MAG: hypothetical protein DMF84_20025 [Acidobacteria bacterium]|nr:MAG: hypothetical protein DMF84_20025 [Acidobacteriota bacterium]
MEIADHARRNEQCPRAGELAVIQLAAADEIVLEPPGVRRLGIFLDVPRHDGVTAAADRHVERRARTSRVGQARRKAHALDEPLGVERRVDLSGPFALPPLIAIFLGLS